MNWINRAEVFQPGLGKTALTPEAIACADIHWEENVPFRQVFLDFVGWDTMEKYVICNCCWPDASAQTALMRLFMEEIVYALCRLAAVSHAQAVLTVCEGSDLQRSVTAFLHERDDSPDVIALPGARILAESTALYQAIENGTAMTRPGPGLPDTSEGLHGNPTICARPELYFRLARMDDRPATLAVLPEKGLYEVGSETTFSDIVWASGCETPKFLQFGDICGPIIPTASFDQTVLSVLAHAEWALCDGIVTVCSEATCAVDWLGKHMESARRESCGKCVVCRLGCRQIGATALAVSAAEATTDELENIAYVADGMEQLAACAFGRAVGHMVRTYMDAYAEEFEQHIRRKKCASLVCRGYITYHVLPAQCQGCCACQNACNARAILGETGEIHVIDAGECVKCGACEQACPNDAIVRAGVLKPRTPREPIPVGEWKR